MKAAAAFMGGLVPEARIGTVARVTVQRCLAIRMCGEHRYRIAEIVLANELSLRDRAEIDAHIGRVARTMSACIDSGMRAEGMLLGGLRNDDGGENTGSSCQRRLASRKPTLPRLDSGLRRNDDGGENTSNAPGARSHERLAADRQNNTQTPHTVMDDVSVYAIAVNEGDGIHHVSLDQVISTMRQTGADMQVKYKETSLGGLALDVPNC